jgi:predicted GH43/DUF377 family glycosyl hydrolase
VLAHQSGTLAGVFVDPGAVTFYAGRYHMFFDGINGWPSHVQIGYATSTDGRTWTRVGDTAVFTTEKLSYAGLTAFASSVVVQDDGTWALYYYTLDKTSDGQNFAQGEIGRATAPAPAGPWTADPAPVLQTGSAGSWDSYQVSNPSVVKVADGYVMYFSGGSSGSGQRLIGMATSNDGIHWTKYDDPKTTDEPHAESDPVFGPGPAGAWDSARVVDPNVQQTPDGWVMVYLADKGKFNGDGLGVAVSADGLHWRRVSNDPIIGSKQAGWTAFYLASLVFHDNTYFVYFDATNGGSSTNVFMASHTGLLTQ